MNDTLNYLVREIITNLQEYSDYEIDNHKIKFIEKNCDNIINYISITYNMNDIAYLISLSNINIEYLIYYIQKNESFRDNNVLDKLFKNYIDNTTENLQLKVVGPYYYRHYSGSNFTVDNINYGNINIYLYGEKHFEKFKDKYKNFPYINFENYINLLLQNSSSFSDLYIENWKDIVIDISESYKSDNVLLTLYNTHKKFKECETKKYHDKWVLSEIESCKLFRYHYIDIRTINDNTLQNILHNLIFLDEVEDELYIGYINKFIYKLKIIKSYIKDNINYEERKKLFIDFFVNEILNDSLVLKEISRTIVRDIIYNFIYEKLVYNVENFINKKYNIDRINLLSEILNILINQPNVDVENIKDTINDSIESLNDELVKIYSVMMDCYTLSRIFKPYKGVSKQPNYARNIYIYAGAAHCKTYSEFFEYLDFKLEKQFENDSDNYIEIDLKLPKLVIDLEKIYIKKTLIKIKLKPKDGDIYP